MKPLILASSSPYRQALLSKLNIPYTCQSPDINEARFENEHAAALVIRLAEQKAQAVAKFEPKALIIGSDQVATVNDQILCKPGDFATAHQQLSQCSGQTVSYLTGLCLLNPESGKTQLYTEYYKLHFRELNADEISNYLNIEQPYDCAGSIKSEGLAISLFKRHEGRDPNALVGLPLIQLLTMLRNEGVNPLNPNW